MELEILRRSVCARRVQHPPAPLLIRAGVDALGILLLQVDRFAGSQRPGQYPSRLDRHFGDLHGLCRAGPEREQAVIAQVDRLGMAAVPLLVVRRSEERRVGKDREERRYTGTIERENSAESV